MIDEKMIKRIERECRLIDDGIITYRSKINNVYEFRRVNLVTLSFLLRSNRQIIIRGNKEEWTSKTAKLVGNDIKEYYAPTIIDAPTILDYRE